MKIQTFDVPHIINQIKRASPPKDKETHKFLNNLAILLEKNTTKKNSPLESSLVSTTDKLNETFLDLCFRRKELVKRFSQDYFDIVNNAFTALKRNKDALETLSIPQVDSINWDLKTMSDSNSSMPLIFSKLQKARSIIEDAIEKNDGMIKDANGCIDAFFSTI
ncbi:uncharacterized protein VICG_01398 [Vittaforma corneae ATCC 50505]|uniref:Uncharacterized protein n=1 Tax=Vittaforma corneae (strain ATCC 50505) TaxID=993615 RepID=L2GLM1_VITCO|nr:uncharacterized protein VICG_01398 [Vittaforma corneae ATCC 50505]ELA41534.1 hypothetical protein VICG_01398 [Vittaforma corneae ATCC 50505]